MPNSQDFSMEPPLWTPPKKDIWTPSQELITDPDLVHEAVGHLTADSERPYAGSTDDLLEDNAYDVDPALIPQDFHNVSMESAVRLTPATFAFHVSQGMWQPADHLLYIASEIARELLEGNAHLIVSMPPRHGKSELLSVWTALWWLDLFPEDLILLTTYGADLSQGFSRRVRDMFIELGGIDGKRSPEHKLAGRPRLRTHVRSDIAQAGHFMTPQGGGMTAVGIGGPITGRGANLLFVDDYVKNAEDAASPTNQQKDYDWFVSTAYTRLEPGGSVVILATRWDQNDLIGQVLRNQGEFGGVWRVIELPALAHANEVDPLGRKPGEALWSARYTMQRLIRIRSMLGPYFWNALYQQRPIRKTDVKFEGDLFTPTDEVPPMSRMRLVRSWDLAGTEGGGDWTVGSLIGQDGPPRRTSTNTFLYDVKREQVAQEKLEQLLLATAEEDSSDVPIYIEQEPGSSGKNYANYLKDTVLREYKVTVKPPSSDKWLKAQPFFACVARGNAKMRRAGWNKQVKQEFTDFPGGKNDDIVDSVSQGYNFLVSSAPKSVTWGRTSTTSGVESTGGARKLVRGAVFGRRT